MTQNPVLSSHFTQIGMFTSHMALIFSSALLSITLSLTAFYSLPHSLIFLFLKNTWDPPALEFLYWLLTLLGTLSAR